MRELAAQLIDRNSAPFDPSRFEDRCEQALIALARSKAKPAGKAAKGAANDDAAVPASNVVNLMEVLKRSIQNEKSGSSALTEAAKAVAGPTEPEASRPDRAAGTRPAKAKPAQTSKRAAAGVLKKAS